MFIEACVCLLTLILAIINTNCYLIIIFIIIYNYNYIIGILSVSFSQGENGNYSYVGYPVKRNGTLSKTMLEKSETDNLHYLRVSKRNIEAKGVENSTPTQDNHG